AVLCAERAGEGFPRRLRGPWAKLPAQLARLALILHALGDPRSDQVSAETLARAADLLDYFQAHARRAYQHLVQVRRDLATRILPALRERGPLTTTELHEVLQRNVTAERLRTTLENLEEAGLVQRETQQGEGRGRPATVWRLALAN